MMKKTVFKYVKMKVKFGILTAGIPQKNVLLLVVQVITWKYAKSLLKLMVLSTEKKKTDAIGNAKKILLCCFYFNLDLFVR